MTSNRINPTPFPGTEPTAFPMPLGQVLLERGLVTEEAIERALESQGADNRGRLIGEILVDEAKQQVRAALESLELPWNARSVRSYFLRKVGVCIARVVGSQLATAKWRGRRELGLRKVAQEAADAARRRPSGLAGTQRVTLPARQQPSRAMSLA